jgi:hypothetical protein
MKRLTSEGEIVVSRAGPMYLEALGEVLELGPFFFNI